MPEQLSAAEFEQLQSEDDTRLWVIYYIVIGFAVLFGIAVGVGGTLVVLR